MRTKSQYFWIVKDELTQVLSRTPFTIRRQIRYLKVKCQFSKAKGIRYLFKSGPLHMYTLLVYTGSGLFGSVASGSGSGPYSPQQIPVNLFLSLQYCIKYSFDKNKFHL